MPRVAIGGISHETNTFSSIQTTLTDFQRRALARGRTIIETSRGAGTALGGMVDTSLALRWDLVPTLFASATPSGRIRRGAFESLANELVGGIAAAAGEPAGLAGVLLALHGAMVAEALDDADGEILRRVRRAVGPDVPIAVVLDSHANMTPQMVEHADILLAYETYPHIDTYARGSQAVRLLEQRLLGEILPTHALRQIPLLTPLTTQWTAGPTPMRDLALLAEQARHERSVLSIALASGFPYSDIHDAGMAVLVTTDGDPAAANAIADRLAAACWERRSLFESDLTPVDAAVSLAMAAERGPVVLADVADNPGGGASGDGTTILAALLAARAESAVVAMIADPETVRQAELIGAGNRGRLRLGGKTDHLHGPTLELDARVRWTGDLTFVNRGPMGTGTTTRLGSSAVIEVGDPPVEVIVATNRVQALDPELLRAAGIEPESRRVIVLKSSVHFRAAFGPLAAGIIEVDGPGLSSPDLLSFPYRRVRRPIWPLDRDMR
ncbi:MAG TPA: M81 family metallopeptidase [Thermomicrobiales bacterium]|nr:M81 family metallopeptidase [Thermomicrobiales bacterium]